MSAHELRFALKEELPKRVAVGAGTRRFVRGWCFHPHSGIRSLSIAVDGEAHPVEAHSQPRTDLHWRISAGPDAGLHPYRSGFWAYVPLSARNGTRIARLELVAELEDGSLARAPLPDVELVPESSLNGSSSPPADSPPPAARGAGRQVAIAMATYNPPPELLERQLDSIRNQSHENWICVISDDMSRPDRYEHLVELTAGDDRIHVSRSGERLGFYRNFERALNMVPREAELVCFCDQDDRWHPDKLAILVEQMAEGVTLAYSDARIIDEQGALISETFWSERPTNHTDLADLLIANTVTGAASLFDRELLDAALPFPQFRGEPYHDHWLACVALARGEVRYVERPLYDYVQHGDQALGHTEANRRKGVESAWRLRLKLLRPSLAKERVREILAWWSVMYFADVCRISLASRVLLDRCGGQMAPGKRRAAVRIVAAEQGWTGLAWMLWRRCRRLGRRSPTLHHEGRLARAILWRRLVSAGLIGRAPRRPDVQPLNARDAEGGEEWLQIMERKLAPLELRVSGDAPDRVNVLLPDLDLDHFFGGYIAKFNLARRLAERGRQVRVVLLDGDVVPPADWRERLSAFEGLGSTLERIEMHDASVRSVPLEVGSGDSFIATTWWSAHVATRAAQELGRERFVYLIQEYEPFTFPMSSMAALAEASYAAPHSAIFSSGLLRDWFRDQGIGVFATGRAAEAGALAFENALTQNTAPAPQELARQRLLFYARPEPHAARNMYELGHLGLSAAVADGVFDDGWELYGTGAQRRGTTELGGRATMELLPRGSQRDYATLLRTCSVGLALMYTPHPSLVPLEMAAAGMVVVTNTFANKTAEALSAISPNLIAVEPTVDGVRRGLREAALREVDLEARVRGADVSWARSWDESFDDGFMQRVEALLDES